VEAHVGVHGDDGYVFHDGRNAVVEAVLDEVLDAMQKASLYSLISCCFWRATSEDRM
jgi:hypothetical protein